MFGLDITRQVRVNAGWLRRLAGLSTPVAGAAAGMLGFYGAGGGALHDVVAIGSLLRPEYFAMEPCGVTIVTDPGDRAGQSIVDRNVGSANASVGFRADGPEFLEFLLSRLESYG